MKLFIDDMRDPPEGWDLARSSEEAIDKIHSNRYDVISFDHDLGDADKLSGYDVLCMVEQDASHHVFPYRIFIMIHTANSSVIGKMLYGARSIHNLLGVLHDPILWDGFHVPKMPNM